MLRAGNNRLKRLPAFTILELTVVMFLTTVVIGTAYMAWGIVWQQFNGYQGMSNQIAELSRVEMALRKDMEKADRVTRFGDAITFWHPTATNITYSINSQSVIRTAGQHADTIAVDITNIETKQLEIGTNTPALVERLEIHFTQYNRPQTLFFTKDYGVATRMLADQQNPKNP